MIEPLNLLQNMIRCKSVTPENDGILELIELELKNLGFSVEIKEFHEEGTYSVKNIYAKYGTGDLTLGFCGHLDVVPAGDEKLWSSPPFAAHIINNEVVGRGAADMKSGIACFISALSRFLPNFNSENGSIVLLLTLDEEQLAINGIPKLIKYVVNEKKQHINACLLGEPTCINYVGDTIKIGRRGSLNFNIKVKGKQGHVAYHKLASNPLRYLVDIIFKINNLKLDSGNNNFEPSNIEIVQLNTSSNKYNVIPEYAEAKGNVRFNNNYKSSDIKTKLESIVNKYKDASISYEIDSSEPFLLDDNSKIFKAMEAAIFKETSKTPKKDTLGGTSDARFLKDYTEVIEFGIIENTIHQVNERVDIKDIMLLSKIYETFLVEYFK